MTKVKKRKSGGKYQGEQLHLIKLHWFGGRCMARGCDEDDIKKLELAHAIETDLSLQKPSGFRSSYERLKDTIENPECFLLFCRSDHLIYDGKVTPKWKQRWKKSKGLD